MEVVIETNRGGGDTPTHQISKLRLIKSNNLLT